MKANKNKDDDCTFQPEINVTSEILCRADTRRANETPEEAVERMHKVMELKELKKKQAAECYYAQFDFKPKINKMSEILARDSTLYSRIESNKFKKAKESEQQKEKEHLTFKPTINKGKYEDVPSNYRNDETLMVKIKEGQEKKQKVMEEKKKKLQKESLKDCTYAPKVGKEPDYFNNPEPIVVKGFSRYLDQMDKARQNKREKEERAKEVFVDGSKWNADQLITVPKPFKLSYEERVAASRREELERKVECEVLKECTFQPKTNEMCDIK